MDLVRAYFLKDAAVTEPDMGHALAAAAHI